MAKKNLGKETNPKDGIGIKKAPLSTVPTSFIFGIGLVMMTGARKYGRHNYRIGGVRASVYFDAMMRHIWSWYEGQDLDPESGLSHLYHAGACLSILDDAEKNGMLNDDRPPIFKNQEWMKEFNVKAAEIIARYPESKEPYTKSSKKL